MLGGRAHRTAQTQHSHSTVTAPIQHSHSMLGGRAYRTARFTQFTSATRSTHSGQPTAGQHGAGQTQHRNSTEIAQSQHSHSTGAAQGQHRAGRVTRVEDGWMDGWSARVRAGHNTAGLTPGTTTARHNNSAGVRQRAVSDLRGVVWPRSAVDGVGQLDDERGDLERDLHGRASITCMTSDRNHPSANAQQANAHMDEHEHEQYANCMSRGACGGGIES